MQIQNSLHLVGKITQPHGLKGHVLIHIISGTYDWIEEIDGFSLENGKTLTIKTHQTYKNGLRVLFVGIDDRNKAEELKQLKLFIDKSHLTSKPGEDIYLHEILGFKIIDKSLGNIGVIDTFEHHPSNDLLVVKYNNKECLIPFAPELIINIDFENQVIEMDLPEGLLDL